MSKTIIDTKRLTYRDGDDFKEFVNKFLELEKEYDSFEVSAFKEFDHLDIIDIIEIEFIITREETEKERKERIKKEKELLISKIDFHKNLMEKFQNQFNNIK